MALEAFSYRSDPAVPAFPDDRPIIIFDGKCVLCSGTAQFVMRWDRRRRFRLLAAQTAIGTALYRHFGLDPVGLGTIILLADGRARVRSDAAIGIVEGLGLPWSLLAVARLIPKSLRDRFYNLVARNRLTWFGVRDTCFLPDPSQADRFLS